MNRRIARWTLASAVALLAAPVFAEDDHNAASVEEQLEAALVVLPEARPRTTVVDAGRFHLTVPSDVVVSRNELWDPEGSIEVLDVRLAPLGRTDAAPDVSFLTIFWFPTPADAPANFVDATIDRMTNAFKSTLDESRVLRDWPNTNELGELTVRTMQFEYLGESGELNLTIGGAELDGGALVIYAHLDPASGNRNRSLFEVIQSFAVGPAPEPVEEPAEEPASDDGHADDHAADDHAADDHAADDHAGHDHDDHAGHNH